VLGKLFVLLPPRRFRGGLGQLTKEHRLRRITIFGGVVQSMPHAGILRFGWFVRGLVLGGAGNKTRSGPNRSKLAKRNF
jgi:hypothetical protein